ncbi:MAG: hypothetical protein NZL95_04205 [Chitinophagales bacterium]|nr:hypothetical protein [Chitinophagales bacterium]MDW8427733.1 hypothetical protein [Chitinophagales bacterium]
MNHAEAYYLCHSLINETNMSEGQKASTAEPSRRNRNILFVVLILLLLASNIYLYLRIERNEAQTQMFQQKINEDSLRLAELDQLYQEALMSLESYKGQNASLDSLIAVKEQELSQLREQYATLSLQKRLSEEEARKAMERMRAVIADLQEKIRILEEEKKVLIARGDSLTRTVSTQTVTISQLKKSTQELAVKANLLYTTSVHATGVKVKGKGKEVETDNAKKADRLRVCFALPAAGTVAPGEKTFYVRIISPEGVTLSDGSSVLTKAETGTQVQYTSTVTVDYDQTDTSVCAYWEQASPFQSGTYTVEIYQNGFLIGKSDFTLK